MRPSPAREILVYPSAGLARPLEVEGFADASNLLSREASASCIIIESSGRQAEDSRQIHHRLSTRSEEVGILLGEPCALADVPALTVTPWAPGSATEATVAAGVCTLHWGRVLYANVTALAEIPPMSSDTSRSLNLEVLRSLVIRHTASQASFDLSSSTAQLHADLHLARIRALDEDLEALARAAERAMAGSIFGDAQLLLSRLLSYRSRLRMLATVAARVEQDSYVVQLRTGLAELDALGAFLSAHLLVRLFDSTETTRQREQQRDRDEDDARRRLEDDLHLRDQGLARVVAALIPPSIWVSYRGTTAAPSLSPLVGNLTLWGGAAAAAIIGLVTVRILYRGASVPDPGKASDEESES